MIPIIVIFQYQYCSQPQSTQVQYLVRIVLNTLDAQHHVCRQIPRTVVMTAPSRSRGNFVNIMILFRILTTFIIMIT